MLPCYFLMRQDIPLYRCHDYDVELSHQLSSDVFHHRSATIQCAVSISHSSGCRHTQLLQQPPVQDVRVSIAVVASGSDLYADLVRLSTMATERAAAIMLSGRKQPIAARGQALDYRRSSLLLILPGRHDNTKEAAARHVCAQAATTTPMQSQLTQSH